MQISVRLRWKLLHDALGNLSRTPWRISPKFHWQTLRIPYRMSNGFHNEYPQDSVEIFTEFREVSPQDSKKISWRFRRQPLYDFTRNLSMDSWKITGILWEITPGILGILLEVSRTSLRSHWQSLQKFVMKLSTGWYEKFPQEFRSNSFRILEQISLAFWKDLPKFSKKSLQASWSGCGRYPQ